MSGGEGFYSCCLAVPEVAIDEPTHGKRNHPPSFSVLHPRGQWLRDYGPCKEVALLPGTHVSVVGHHWSHLVNAAGSRRLAPPTVPIGYPFLLGRGSSTIFVTERKQQYALLRESNKWSQRNCENSEHPACLSAYYTLRIHSILFPTI